MTGVFRHIPALPQPAQAPSLATFTKAVAVSGGGTVSPRGDISTMHVSQYGFGHKRRRRRLPNEAHLKRVFLAALLADQSRPFRKAA